METTGTISLLLYGSIALLAVGAFMLAIWKIQKN
jgi:hypothetical protein